MADHTGLGVVEQKPHQHRKPPHQHHKVQDRVCWPSSLVPFRTRREGPLVMGKRSRQQLRLLHEGHRNASSSRSWQSCDIDNRPHRISSRQHGKEQDQYRLVHDVPCRVHGGSCDDHVPSCVELVHSRKVGRSKGHLRRHRSLQPGRSIGSTQFGVGSWKSHKKDSSNHLVVVDSCLEGKASESRRHDRGLDLMKARPRWPFR